jgi:hypothetical protein
MDNRNPRLAELDEDSVLEHLNIGQMAALEALATGESVNTAATTAGVHPRTVTRWITNDPLFRSAYNSMKRSWIESTRTILLNTAPAAAAAINKAVVKGDARIAMALLAKLNLAGMAAVEPTNPGLVHEQIDAERVAQEREVLERQLGRGTSSIDRNDLRRKLADLRLHEPPAE